MDLFAPHYDIMALLVKLLFNHYFMNSSHYPILELCKKLTEAGFPRTTMFTQQSSSFMENWYLVMNTKIRDEIFNPKCFENWSTTADMKKEIVYPSVMELLDEMPKEIIEG